jgi:hypothetical protein
MSLAAARRIDVCQSTQQSAGQIQPAEHAPDVHAANLRAYQNMRHNDMLGGQQQALGNTLTAASAFNALPPRQSWLAVP